MAASGICQAGQRIIRLYVLNISVALGELNNYIILKPCKLHPFFHFVITRGGGGGAVAQSVERATPGKEVPGSIPAVAARSILVRSVSV